MAAHRTPVRTLLRGRAPPRVLGSADLGVVARTMVGAQVDALPVVDREGRLLGLITLRHLAELAAGASIQPQSSAG
jgi:CBS domain-containing protein